MSDAASSSPGPRAALSRDFSEFLIELSISLHKHAMYPMGHPSLGPAAEAVTEHAERLLVTRDMVAFGVARQQLIIEGVATDPKQPVLRRLAEGLHRHHLGAVSILRGVRPDEIGIALRALAAEAERDGPIGLTANGQLPGVQHVRLHPLTFDGLALAGDAPMSEGGTGKGGSKGAELWVGLARAALAGDGPSEPRSSESSESSESSGEPGSSESSESASRESAEPGSAEPSVVAKAIDQNHGAKAYDQVIVGYLLQIAGELRTASGAEAEALRGRTASLIGALRPETLRRLVEMGGDVAQRNAFVLNATHGMAVDAVVDIVKAAANASGQTISHGLVRMLSKLSAHAEMGQEQAKPIADAALREQIQSLLSEWQLADPNPDDYRQMLQYLATSAPTAVQAAGTNGDGEALRLVQMSLEVGTSGPLVDRAVASCVNSGRVSAVIDLLDRAPAGSQQACEQVRARLTQPMAIGMLAAREPFDDASLDVLLPFISLDGYGVLLDALAGSQSRATRRKLLDRLAKAPIDVAALVAGRLEDDRWYVQRNMLVLLERLKAAPEGFSAAKWAAHPDARVRCEAIRLQLAMPASHRAAIQAAFRDPDPRVLRVGLSAVQQNCPPEVMPWLVGVAQGTAVPDELRLLAVQALAHSRNREALECLVSLADGGRNLFGRMKLAPKSPVVVAALRALAGQWRAEPRAAALLALASSQPDDEIRNAVRQAER